MRLVLREVVADQRRLRRAVEVVLDVVVAPDLRELGDVERALVEGEPVRAMQAGGDDLGLVLAILLGEGIDLVEEARADEHRALVADANRAGIADARGEYLDLEALRNLELRDRQL